jgi:hypothetical protein
MKRLVLAGLLLNLMLLGVELGSQLIWRVAKGQWVLQQRRQEQFNVRDFTVLTDDARGFTAQPEYANPDYHGWRLSFDRWGFRQGAHVPLLRQLPLIVFLGDSVPFGFGVNDEQTLPSQFSALLPVESHVVNAALPSYNLAQAVARYAIEIHGRFAVDTVYLQTYDPASQLTSRGAAWQMHHNWMNAPGLHHQAWWSTYSATGAILHHLWLRVHGEPPRVERFDPEDHETAERVVAAVAGELDRLWTLAQEDGATRLILAPITIAPSAHDTLSSRRLAAIALVNHAVWMWAINQRPMVIWVNTIGVVSRAPEAEVFLDQCCHLTAEGNRLMAAYLWSILQPERATQRRGE